MLELTYQYQGHTFTIFTASAQNRPLLWKLMIDVELQVGPEESEIRGKKTTTKTRICIYESNVNL